MNIIRNIISFINSKLNFIQSVQLNNLPFLFQLIEFDFRGRVILLIFLLRKSLSISFSFFQEMKYAIS